MKSTTEAMTNFAEVHPLNASPEIAAIYADIRAVSGLSMVNLIWRHFATFPEIIQWAWKGVRPLVASQELVASRQRLINAIELPSLQPITFEAWQSLGLSAPALADMRTITSDYIRGNCTNIIVLTALRLRLEGIDQPSPKLSVGSTPKQMAPLAPLPRIETLEPSLAASIRSLANHHEGAQGGIIPSLYLELARWPALAEVFSSWLGALYDPKAMRTARASTCRAAEAEAMTMLPSLDLPPPNVSQIRPALDRFTRLIIPDLTPVCVALLKVLPVR